ncbi:MAG: GxxExxY protein [Gemmatimonadaceae bacterium]
MKINTVTGLIVDAAMKVHSALGPGLLESAYEACLAHELRRRELEVSTQVAMPIVYDGVALATAYRIDLLVEGVVVEVKAVAKLMPIHVAQVLSYLRLGGRPVGLLLNFQVLHMRDGVKRIANSA